MNKMSDVTLRDYFERRLLDLDAKYASRMNAFNKRFEERFYQNDVALNKAEKTMNERLNSMNEFRDALKDQSSRMATRVELDKIDEAVRQLQNAKSNLEGRFIMISGSISIVVSVFLWFLSRIVK